MQFLSSDLISSPSFRIDENMIHFQSYQYGSVLVTRLDLLFSSLAFWSYPFLWDVTLYNIRWCFIYYLRFPRVKSSRSLRHIPSNTRHHNILSLSCRASDFHNLQSPHDVSQYNVLLTFTLVSANSICTLKDHVLHINRLLTYRNLDVFSTRYTLFLIFFKYFRVPLDIHPTQDRFDTHYRRMNWKDTPFLNSRYSPMYWRDRSDWFRRLHSSKNRQRRILWMIHNSVVVHRLETSSTFRNRFRDDLMTISSIKSSNHKNEWTTSIWHSSAKIQYFVVNFFDVSSCSLTVTSVTRSTIIHIYIYIYINIEEIRLLISFHEDDRNSERTRDCNLILVSIWAQLSTGSEESELLVCAQESIQHSSRKWWISSVNSVQLLFDKVDPRSRYVTWNHGVLRLDVIRIMNLDQSVSTNVLDRSFVTFVMSTHSDGKLRVLRQDVSFK